MTPHKCSVSLLREVYRFVDAGDLPAYKRHGQLEFRRKDLDARRTTAARLAEERRDRDAERRRALDLAQHATRRYADALGQRDAAIMWAAIEHRASIREISEATGIAAMTVKRIIERHRNS